ncbi:hypothetical protein P6709_09160 [Jeotgalibacillus sp. ET6]|uniref:hypothetical protein n=1 Tax=Jeotgalibacillus sp. ET6 TaxID=3037260 RepID=UPI0024186F2D|nr:hypothetical protein [Jeotgalibacillus sp. ET6]MDG5471916.1 hypothetical protein [Jeotgalibacillus sp. ET6]
MKKNIVVLLVFLVLIIGFWGVFNYISHNGEFTKLSHSTLGRERFEDGNAHYFDYHFRWEGMGNPIIEKVEFVKSDGTIVTKEDDEIRIHPFISSSESIGVLDEETTIKERLLNELVEVKSFQVDEDFHLVLRVELNVINLKNDISSLRITYRNFGVTHYQYIPFDDGIVTN